VSENVHGLVISTRRLRLVPATVELARAEMSDRSEFARLLGADIPGNWPPESAADALPFFLELLEGNPTWVGWLGWYAIATLDDAAPTLVGSGGFFGPPDGAGEIETGYSVLPQFHRRGIATEMVGGLIGWATSHESVHRVVARTTEDNVGSRRVLETLGFAEDGPSDEPGGIRFVRI
jgi:RimJ/RimL family protein N-acetyltransferase